MHLLRGRYPWLDIYLLFVRRTLSSDLNRVTCLNFKFPYNFHFCMTPSYIRVNLSFFSRCHYRKQIILQPGKCHKYSTVLHINACKNQRANPWKLFQYRVGVFFFLFPFFCSFSLSHIITGMGHFAIVLGSKSLSS